MARTDQPHLYVSYSPENIEIAAALKQELARLEIDAWIDHCDRKAGQVFPASARNALLNAQAMLILWSDIEAQSMLIEQESECCKELEKHLLIAQLDNTPIPFGFDTERIFEFENARTLAFDIKSFFDEITNEIQMQIVPPEKKVDWSRLRSESAENLTEIDLEFTTQKYNFFEAKLNPNSKRQILEFHVYDNFKVVDEYTTGLAWQISGSAQSLTFATALNFIKDLNRERYAGFSDWRMPTSDELFSISVQEKNRHSLHIPGFFQGLQKCLWSIDRERGGQHIVFNAEEGKYEFVDQRAMAFVRAVRTLERLR